MKNVNQTIVETFREVAEYLETGRSNDQNLGARPPRPAVPACC